MMQCTCPLVLLDTGGRVHAGRELALPRVQGCRQRGDGKEGVGANQCVQLYCIVVSLLCVRSCLRVLFCARLTQSTVYPVQTMQETERKELV